MIEYNYESRTIDDLLKSLYTNGLNNSKYLSNEEIKQILTNIGMFKFKGYCYAFKGNLSSYTIDDIFMLYFFDKYLTRIVMDLTSSIETKLKTTLVEACYARLQNLPPSDKNKNNPFFYLINRNYKRAGFKINNVTVGNWKPLQHSNGHEAYSHYGLYYQSKYSFTVNKNRYIGNERTIELYPDINYPPFHYIIEGATLDGVNRFIESLKIGHFDVLKAVSQKFGVSNHNAFRHYLKRLNELRNRAAHRERVFNRNYRSIQRSGKFREISSSLNNHKFMDVYLYLFFMLGRIDEYENLEDFEIKELKVLFLGFRNDYFINKDSYGLIGKMNGEDFMKIKNFIVQGMR